jgi:hypothetical protein
VEGYISMIVLSAIATAQTITPYVRGFEGSTFNITVIDESLNSSDSNLVSGVISDGILTIDVTYNFIEGRFYMVKIYSGSQLVNFSKIYCTDQTDLENYSVTDDYYTQPTKDETTYITK